MSEMVDRHAAVLKDYVRDGDVETARSVSVAALLAALDPEDEALVQAVIAKLDYANPYKEDVAGNILWAIRDLMSDAAQGGRRPNRFKGKERSDGR